MKGRGTASPRVTIATRLFPPEPGAAAFRLGALARALLDEGAVVDVLTTVPPHGTTPSDPTDLRVSRWPVLRDAGGNVRGYLQFASFDGPLLARLLARRAVDVLVVEPPPTTGTVVRLVAAARRVPYAYYAGDVSSTAAAGIGVSSGLVAVLRRVEAFAMSGSSVVLAVSEGVADEVRRLTHGRVPVVVVGTGVDTAVFRPMPTTAGQTPTLVYAGTMSEVHGASVFVEAFARVARQHPEARLLMYGQGSEEAALHALANRVAPGQVRFPGVVPGEEIAVAMSSAYAGLASLRPDVHYDYAFPTKMFAATACGTPVVYSGPGPGAAMVREHELGWSCDWDIGDVASAFSEALSTPPTAERRTALTEWTQEWASQRSVSVRAAEAVIDVARRGRRTPYRRNMA